MKRLSDEDLAAAIDMAERGQIEAPLLRLRTSLGDDMSKSLLNVLYELRERRAADLTAAEREALQAMQRDIYRGSNAFDEASWFESARDVLDKLLAGGGR